MLLSLYISNSNKTQKHYFKYLVFSSGSLYKGQSGQDSGFSIRTDLRDVKTVKWGEKIKPYFLEEGSKSHNAEGNILGSLHFFRLLLHLSYKIMRSYEHIVSKKQPRIFGRLFFIIVGDTNFCEALFVQQINVTLTSALCNLIFSPCYH